LISVFLAISQAGANTLNGLNIHHSAAALPHLNKSFHSGFSFTVISAALVTIFCNHSSNHSSNELHTYFLVALDTISSNGLFVTSFITFFLIASLIDLLDEVSTHHNALSR
jgi:hypothetical protein